MALRILQRPGAPAPAILDPALPILAVEQQRMGQVAMCLSKLGMLANRFAEQLDRLRHLANLARCVGQAHF